MPSSKDLSQYFAQAGVQQSQADLNPTNSSHSKAIDAEDDDHFETTTFQLKRTRSVGLLDEFIAPTKKLIEEDLPKQPSLPSETKSRLDDFNDYDDDDENTFIENVDDLPKTQKKKPAKIYTYNENNIDEDEYNDDSHSPSPPDSPDLYQPHDDNDIVYEPSRHVDYLSHNWKELDIQKSWRYIVLKRKDVANAARLENASWRTWAQARYHLETITPESVNWSKDSDVNWLYGPLYKEPDHNANSEGNDADKKYGSDGESSKVSMKREKKKKSQQKQTTKIKGPKPILKKRTVSEMLSQPSMIKLPYHHHHYHNKRAGQSPTIETSMNAPSPPQIEDDFDEISRKVNAQYRNQPQVLRSQSQQPPKSSNSLLSSASDLKKEEMATPAKRHIHFNDRVEQCIALNYPDTEEEYDSEYDDTYDDRANEGDVDDDNDDYSDDSDEEGGFFLRVKSPSSAQLHNKELTLSRSRGDDEDEEGGDEDGDRDTISTKSSSSKFKFNIIEPLPATTLKYGSDEEEEDDDKFALSHNVNTSRGYNYHYDYNSVFPTDSGHVQIGGSNYEIEDTPQHLEGVNLVDVPDNIQLGSLVDSSSMHNDTPIMEPDQSLLRSGSRASGFNLHSDSDSGSDSEPEETELTSNTSSPTSASQKNNISKISSSPSYASLSDVAAQGYISQSTADMNELQKDFGNLNSSSSNESENSRGFKASLLNSWKK